jgi:hypothetical protein
MFLVHAVEHRKIDRLCVDQLNVTAALAHSLDDEISQSDSHAIRTIRAVEDEDATAHDITAAIGQSASRQSLHRRWQSTTAKK